MGIHVIKMPDIGEGIAEVELVAWHVKEGETVAEDQILADVMTDKANVEIPSPVAGKVLKLGGEVGKTMAVGSELIRLEVEGVGNVRESSAPAVVGVDVGTSGAVLSGAGTSGAGTSGAGTSGAVATGAATPTPTPTAGSKPAPITADDAAKGSVHTPRAAPNQTRDAGERPIASPAVRRHAWDLGVELQFVQGSGPAGRIMHEDIDAHVARRGASASGEPGQPGQSGERGQAGQPGQREQTSPQGARNLERNDSEQIPVIGLRRRIAQKMQESKRRIPHFTYVEEIDVTEIESLRGQLNAKHSGTRGKLTMLPFIARAMVVALRDFPQINATYEDDGEGGGTVTRHGAVHLGVAAQTDAGLLVPVVRHAEAKDLWAIGAEVARLADAARTAKASRDELTGSTITLTSLGALGGIVSTPVINHPEVAIVGVNRIVERPMIRAGAVVPRLTMNLSSSFDHRIVDGMDAARFIQAIRALLESPALLFVE